MVGGWWNRDCSTDVGEEKKVLVVLADPKNEDTCSQNFKSKMFHVTTTPTKLQKARVTKPE